MSLEAEKPRRAVVVLLAVVVDRRSRGAGSGFGQGGHVSGDASFLVGHSGWKALADAVNAHGGAGAVSVG